ncbi:MAG: GAF and ANTAR domain-containing protein [Acidimicrobiia bacterium]
MDQELANSASSSAPVDLGGAVLDDDALRELLQKLALLANHTIDDAQAVSITVVDDGRYRTTNSTGAEALAIDEVQYREDVGPCLNAMRSKTQLKVTVDADGSGPGFSEEARRAKVGQVLSTPMVGGSGEAMGAVNVYVHEGGTVGEDEAHTAQLIGDNAALLVGYAFALTGSNRLNGQLHQALETRDVIASAKGVLMQSQCCTRNEAFDILRRASQRANRKLREIAEEVVLRVEGRAASKGSGT